MCLFQGKAFSVKKTSQSNQTFSWVCDAKAETPVLWPAHEKSWPTGKNSDAGRDWGQEEKGTTEDEMAGWHHGLDGRWVCVNSGRWWWTGRPGVLRLMGSQRVGHDWATELNWLLLPPLPSLDQKCQLPPVIGCFCLVFGIWLGCCRMFPELVFHSQLSTDPINLCFRVEGSLHAFAPFPVVDCCCFSILHPFLSVRAKLCFISKVDLGLEFSSLPDRQETCT